jgi:ribonucleoside-diphosphate reductase alpha chain
MRLTRTRAGRTYDFTLGGVDGRLTITTLPDGRPAEVFLDVAKQGSTLAGLCESLSLTTSLALQHRVPVADIVGRLVNMRYEPSGCTADTDVPFATSLSDYLGRRLAADHLTLSERQELGLAR